MKVNFKINTLRGIFLCLTRNKYRLCALTSSYLSEEKYEKMQSGMIIYLAQVLSQS